jgi:hypothetical protein
VTTSREVVTNTALSGSELRKIVEGDFARLLANECMLQDSMAFGRVSYEITLTLHLDNYLMPTSSSTVRSRPVAQNIVAGTHKDSNGPRPDLGAVETFPLSNPSDDSLVGAETLERRINSPNEERLRNEFPVPVIVQERDGTKNVKTVRYPKEESLGDGNVVVTDTTNVQRQRLGMSVPMEIPATVHAAQTEQDVLCKCGRTRGGHALSGMALASPQFPEPCEGFVRFDAPDKKDEAWPVVPS